MGVKINGARFEVDTEYYYKDFTDKDKVYFLAGYKPNFQTLITNNVGVKSSALQVECAPNSLENEAQNLQQHFYDVYKPNLVSSLTVDKVTDILEKNFYKITKTDDRIRIADKLTALAQDHYENSSYFGLFLEAIGQLIQGNGLTTKATRAYKLASQLKGTHLEGDIILVDTNKIWAK